MFRLTREEAGLIFQIEISKVGRGGRRFQPYAFTEQGVAMLSSVLRSERAVAVNILIMRTFVQLRRAINEVKDLSRRIDGIERRIDVHGAVLDDILKALEALESPVSEERREIRVEHDALTANHVDPRLDPRGDRLGPHTDVIGAPLLG